MGVGSGRQRGPCPLPPRIFIHGTNIVDRGLKVLFFGLKVLFFGLFSVTPLTWKFFLSMPLHDDDSINRSVSRKRAICT